MTSLWRVLRLERNKRPVFMPRRSSESSKQGGDLSTRGSVRAKVSAHTEMSADLYSNLNKNTKILLFPSASVPVAITLLCFTLFS